jgi:iron complex outermembrane receptor protein
MEIVRNGGAMLTLKESLRVCIALTIVAAAGGRATRADENPSSQPSADPQSADQPATDQPGGLQEIVVTAEKRASGRSAQKVPIAVTGLDAATMAQTHVQNIIDVGHMAPNVVLDASGTLPGTAAFTIRGVGARSSTASVDSAVAVSQDGMALTLQTGLSMLGTFDTDSVQILRGPQGVLQGVNAAGGAVTFSTPLPTEEFHASASATTGNFGLIGATAVVQGPLTDSVRGKIAVFEQHVDGYYQNTTNEGLYVPAPGNISGREPLHSTGLVGGMQTVIVKPTFQIQMGEAAVLKLFAQFESDIDGGAAPQGINPNPAPGPLSKYNTVYGYTPTPQPYVTNITTTGFTHITEEHLIGDFDVSLGNGVWTTIAAIRNVNFDSVFNNAGSPFNILIVNTKEQNRQASLESRYSGSITDKLGFVAGTYVFADNLPVTVVNANNLAELGKKLVVPTDPNSPANVANQLIQYNQKTTSAALFGNVDYTIIPDLTLSAGLRYQYEHKNMDIQPGAIATGVVYCTSGTLTGCPTTYYNPKKSWYTATPRVVLSYQATPDLLTYAGYSKGWGAGNFNGSPSTLGAAIVAANPETVDSFEVGMKSEWFERRFRANIALFDESFDNIQRTATTSIDGAHVQTLLNAANATIRGAELELTALPFDGGKVFATGGYTNAAYDKFTAALPTNAYNPGYVPTELGFSNLSKWTTDVGGSYRFSIPRVEGDFELATDWSWRSRQWGDFFNTPQEVIDAYGLWNASLNHTHGPWTISLWGRNIRNTYYSEAKSIASGWQSFPGVPRTFGLTVSGNF